MNIAAAMIALRVDLDRAAKHALLVICCHADYPAGRRESNCRCATWPLGMGASLNTAVECQAAGPSKPASLAVDKSPGRITIWRPNCRVATDTPTVAGH